MFYDLVQFIGAELSSPKGSCMDRAPCARLTGMMV